MSTAASLDVWLPPPQPDRVTRMSKVRMVEWVRGGSDAFACAAGLGRWAIGIAFTLLAGSGVDVPVAACGGMASRRAGGGTVAHAGIGPVPSWLAVLRFLVHVAVATR